MVQLKETKIFEQNATTIRESINVDISDADKNVTIIYATADAEATWISNEAKRITIQNTILYEQKAYEDTMRLLQLTPNSNLLDYIYYQNVMKLKNSELIIGLNNALINVNPGKRQLSP